jgi:hypothetical protein
MSDYGTHDRQQRDGLVYGESHIFDAHGVHKLPAHGSRADREAGSDPKRAAKGSEPVASTEREPPRWRPGLRTQGASLDGWLRIVSAPLRY